MNASTSYFTDFYQGLPYLLQSIGYQFSSVELLKRALTHRSYDSKNSYERLEFLGDALLGMVIAKALFHQYPNYDEGKLTRMRATLVRQETLVEIAQDLQLFNHVILGIGEQKGGGRHRASILADCVEAIIGAIYLDCQDIKVLKISFYCGIRIKFLPLVKKKYSRMQNLVCKNGCKPINCLYRLMNCWILLALLLIKLL